RYCRSCVRTARRELLHTTLEKSPSRLTFDQEGTAVSEADISAAGFSAIVLVIRVRGKLGLPRTLLATMSAAGARPGRAQCGSSYFELYGHFHPVMSGLSIPFLYA